MDLPIHLMMFLKNLQNYLTNKTTTGRLTVACPMLFKRNSHGKER